MEYEVEDILDSVVEDGKQFYLVKWRSCDETTWQPLSDLTNCPDLLQDFHTVSTLVK